MNNSMWKLAGVLLLFTLSGSGMAADVTCRDDGEAAKVQQLRPLAEQGDADAQYELGLQYFNGYGVAKNYETATAWFRKAAEQGVAFAQYNLGLMYFYGQGVTQDYREAAAWFRKAGEQEVAKARYNLGMMYAQGKGVAQDVREARAWLLKAAEQGRADAQYSLGQMYRDDEGLVQAHLWFDVAARGGDEQAASDRQEIEARMSTAQIDEAKVLAREWLEKHP